VNLKELSEHLGLSKTTVSRALNGFSDVNEETRKRVVEAAKQLGYTPNANAQRLATGRTDTFGIVFPLAGDRLADPMFSEFVAGVADGAAHCGRGLYVLSATDGEETCYRRLAHNKVVDALILTDMKVEDLRVRLLSHLGQQCVCYGRTASSIPYAHFDLDHEAAFRRAGELLIGLGHRRIALLNGDVRFTIAEHRHVGWVSAFRRAKLAVPEDLLACGAMSEEAGYKAMRRLLGKSEPPSAVICACMFLAAGAVRAIRDAGLQVGRDISLVAHDDGLSVIRPEAYDPPLTTTYASVRAAGARVAEMAAAVADGAEIATVKDIRPVDLIFRDSAQPLRAK
jgi:LacI family transcriptional regulator